MKKKKGVSYAKWGYIFALPFCIAYLIFMIYPVVYTFSIGFTDLTDKLQMQMANEEAKGIETTKVGWAKETQTVMNITLAEGETMPETEYIYVPATGFENGGRYLIVGEIGEGGKQVAFVNSSGVEDVVDIAQRDLKFSLDEVDYSGKVVEIDAKDAVWSATGNDKDGYLLSNGSYCLSNDRNTLTKDKTNKVIYDEATGRLKSVSDGSEDVKYMYYSTYATSSGEELWSWSYNKKSGNLGSRQMWIFEQIPVKKIIEVDDPLENYQFVLTDSNFWKSLGNTCIIWGANFAPQVLLALLLAVWFTNSRNKLRGQGAFKVLFYMPNIITAATIAMLFTKLFDGTKGPVNDVLKMLGVIETNIDFFSEKWLSRGIVAFVQFWMWYGYTMIILISGILGISPELFEAADIDGANGWQKFRYVTLPNLKTIILFTLVTSMIGGMTMFDIPFMIGGNGGVRSNFRTVSVYIYEMSFQGGKLYNRASAASMLMFVLISVLAAVIFFMLRDKDEIVQHKLEKAKEKEFKKALKEQKTKGGVQ